MLGTTSNVGEQECSCGACGWCVAVAIADAPGNSAALVRDLFPRVTRKVALSVLALGAATAALVFGSFAAWTAQTTNPGNSVATGSFAITNSKPAASIFAATGVIPGGNGTSTVTITNSGSAPLAVKLSQDSLTATGVEASLGLKIHDDTRNWCVYPTAVAGACAATYGAWNGTSTLTNRVLLATDGSVKWPVSQAHTFTLSWQLAATSPSSDQGKTGSFRLLWNGS